jgi:hypothetical protein
VLAVYHFSTLLPLFQESNDDPLNSLGQIPSTDPEEELLWHVLRSLQQLCHPHKQVQTHVYYPCYKRTMRYLLWMLESQELLILNLT